MVIKINVTNKRAALVGSPVIVCGNSGYTLEFTFDAEWSAESVRTARFVYVRDGSVQYQDVVFSGTTAQVPVLANIKEVRVGVFAGDLHTSTPALIPCEKSIRCGTGAPEDPTPSQYDQIMELLTAGAGGGVSPVVSVEDIEGGHRVTVTDVLGKKSFDVMNGPPGEPGRAASNPNLIDNWYLAKPVNQRGQTEYTATGYSVDRWYQEGRLICNDGFATHEPIQWYEGIRQNIEPDVVSAIVGRVVTLSMLARSALPNNEIRMSLFDMTTGDLEETHAWLSLSNNWDVVSATFTVPESYSGHTIAVLISTSTSHASNGGGADIIAVKLEFGDEQTLAHQDTSGSWVLNEIPNYGEELAKCQRYQLPLFGSIGACGTLGFARVSGVSVKTAEMIVPIPVTMRATPTLVKGNAAFQLYSSETEYAAVTSIAFSAIAPGFVRLYIVVDKELTGGGVYVLRKTADDLVLLDANL